MIIQDRSYGVSCWIVGFQNQLRLDHCCTCLVPYEAHHSPLVHVTSAVVLLTYNYGIIQLQKHETQIMGYFHPRINLLEVHFRFLQPSALPTKCTQVPE